MAKQENGRRLLDAIINRNKEEVTKLMTKKDLDLNVMEKGDTAIHLAARFGQLHVVQLLRKKGDNINKSNQNGYKPIHYATRFGYTELIEYLVTAGADVNARNDEGDTPLHEAVLHQSMNVIEWLVEKGMGVNLQNKKGEAPLHTAVLNSRQEAMEALIICGANLSIRDKMGRMPENITKNARLGHEIRSYRAMATAFSSGVVKAQGMKIDHKFAATPQEIERVGIIIQSIDVPKDLPTSFYCRREKPENSSYTIGLDGEEETFSDIFHIRIYDVSRDCRACFKIPINCAPSATEELVLKFLNSSGKDCVVDAYETRGKVIYVTVTTVLVPETTCVCGVLVRPRVEETTVGDDGQLIKSNMEENFSLDVPAGAFNDNTVISLSVYETEDYETVDYASDENMEEMGEEEAEAEPPVVTTTKKTKKKRKKKKKTVKSDNGNGDEMTTPSNTVDLERKGELLTDVYQINIAGDQPRSEVTVQVPLKGHLATDEQEEICIIRADENALDQDDAIEVLEVEPNVRKDNLIFDVSHFCIFTATLKREILEGTKRVLEKITSTRARKKRAKFFAVLRRDEGPEFSHTLLVECVGVNMVKYRLKDWTKKQYEAQLPSCSDEVMLSAGDRFHITVEGNAKFEDGFDPLKNNKMMFANGRESYQAYTLHLKQKKHDASPDAVVSVMRSDTRYRDPIVRLPIQMHLPPIPVPSGAERLRYAKPANVNIKLGAVKTK